jgi:hypothetical protein
MKKALVSLAILFTSGGKNFHCMYFEYNFFKKNIKISTMVYYKWIWMEKF